MAYPPSPTPKSKPTPPPKPPRSNSCGLIFAFAWAAVATVAAGVLLALFLIARNDNVVILTALAETSAAGQAVRNEIAAEATAFVLTASVTDTPTNTPTHTATPTETPPITDTPTAPAAPDITLAAGEMSALVGTSVAGTLTAIAPTLPVFTPTNTPQPTIQLPARPAGQAPAPAPARPITLSNFTCRAALGTPNTYQILGTIANVSDAAYFVEFIAEADLGDSRNFPLSPGAAWTIPEGSPNPHDLILVQFTQDGSNYLRLVVHVTACPNNDCTGVAGGADSPTYTLIEGARDQLCQ